jgi:hypothetical protein
MMNYYPHLTFTAFVIIYIMGVFYNAICAQIVLLFVTSLGTILLCADKSQLLECPKVIY